jgi:hypothetical protein
MNENEMLWWIENVWNQRNLLGNPRSLLVLDSFRGHLVNSVKNRFIEKQTNIAVIPGGLTSKLQPLDVSINKSFKSKLRQYYQDWMISEIHELTPAGRIKKPSYSTIAKWVMDSWNDVDTALIYRSFKCCGISVARDGSEDHLLFDYDSSSKKNNEGNNVYHQDEIEESDNESENDLPLDDLEFNEYDEEELTNYENVWD